MNSEHKVNVNNCAICPNMCRFDCPVTGAVKREGVSPAGKMRLGVMRNNDMLPWSRELAAHFYQCTGCKNCQTWCPFEGLSVPALLDIYKAEAVEEGTAPAAVYKLQKDLQKQQTLYPADQLAPLPIGQENPEVLLFAGCAYRSMRPQAVEAGMNLLQAAGLRVGTLADENCCGFPASCMGLSQTNLELAELTLKKIKDSGARILVTSCPECLDSFTRKYPDLGMDLGIEVLHLSTYVNRLVSEGRLRFLRPLPVKTVFHDPCVLGRGLGLYEDPRQALQSIPELSLMEPPFTRAEAHCCGAGQLYETIDGEAALQIADARVEELQGVWAEAVVSSCPFCEDMLGRRSARPVWDLAEVLWAALDPDGGDDWLLRERAKIALKNDAELSGQGIEVTVDRGLATLTGQVETWAQVVKAGLLLGHLPEVYSVVNKLSARELVRNPQPTKSQLPVGTVEHETFDIVVIGGGVIGCSIARELSRFDLKVALLEKESDVSCGTSKANNGMIHPGIFVESGTLKAKLNVRGVELYPQAAEELDFDFDQKGLLGVVTEAKDLFILDIIKAQADNNGVPGVRIMRTGEEVWQMEPNITDKALAAFFAPTSAMVSPYKVTIAYAENAVANGVKMYFETTVLGIEVVDGQVTKVLTDQGIFPTRYVINAAGLYADEIASMAGPDEFTIHPRKGELLLFDKKSRRYSTCLAEVALRTDANTKGGGLMMTVDGNPEIGPTAEEVPDKEDLSTSAAGMEKLLDKFLWMVPGMSRQDVIGYFAGLRAATYTEDYHIRPSRFVAGLINVGGIQSPGLASAPAIAEYVLELLQGQGLKLVPKADFNPNRKEIQHFKDMDMVTRDAMIKQDNRFGNVVCRCELVSEGEIVEAVHRLVPATSLDAVKRRTRVGMGRCQGGFCSPKIAHILARELNVPLTEITKDGAGSWLYVNRLKAGGE